MPMFKTQQFFNQRLTNHILLCFVQFIMNFNTNSEYKLVFIFLLFSQNIFMGMYINTLKNNLITKLLYVGIYVK